VMSESLSLESPAKVNLYLKILKRRKDGYHNIKTIFERINLCDTIIFKERRDKKIRIISSNSALSKDSSNLAYRAADLLRRSFGVNRGLDIKIIKRIPISAGLGGGSANAASVLTGLNKFWRLGLKQEELVRLSRKLGSDVAFFIHNTSFALGEGRGERIKPLGSLKRKKLWHVLVVPKIKVSTPFIYKKWDDNPRTFKLTTPKHDVKILTLAIRENRFSLLAKALFNDLEQVTLRLYPEVLRIKKGLADLGLKAILMSGSGPAVFAIAASKKEAVSLAKKFRTKNKSSQSFAVETL
jgi:4-diphosphocytidyl-2-C-methyl-D-erythritol kinase